MRQRQHEELATHAGAATHSLPLDARVGVHAVGRRDEAPADHDARSVRVELRRVGGVGVPAGAAAEGAAPAGADPQEQGSGADAVAAADSEAPVFLQWQQKVFGPNEVARLHALQEPMGVLDRRYKEEVALNGEKGSRVFTYVHADEFTQREERRRRVTSSERDSGGADGGALAARALSSGEKPRHDVRRKQTMHIVASLPVSGASPARATEGEVTVDVSQQQEERVLCTLKAYADGSFDMRPGFCREGQRYRFMAAGGGVYEYTLTNDADEAPSVVDAKQRLLASSAEARVAALRRQALRRGTIERPAGTGPDAARMLMCAEIVAAKGFRARGVMVEWGFVLDGGPSACKDPEVAAPWTLAASCEATPLSGVTQCSASTKSHEGVPLHHFGHPLEFELECETYPTAKRPTLVLKVSSYDRWDRYRVEGYAYVPVEHTPGMRGTRIVVVDAWRPKGTVEDQLFRFFLGGAPGLKDPRYVEMPEGYVPAEQALSRFGLDTEVGGQLKIRLNTLVHSSRAPRSRAAAKAKAIVDPRTKEERRARAKIEAAELDGVIERARTRLERAKLRGDGEPTAAAVLEEFGAKSKATTPALSRVQTPVRPSARKERPASLFRTRTAPAAVLDTPTEPASRQRVRMLGRQVGPGAAARQALSTTLGDEPETPTRRSRVRLRLR